MEEYAPIFEIFSLSVLVWYIIIIVAGVLAVVLFILTASYISRRKKKENKPMTSAGDIALRLGMIIILCLLGAVTAVAAFAYFA